MKKQNEEIEKKINKLKFALNKTMNKWNGQKKFMQNKFFGNFEGVVDTMQMRNMTYTNNVLKKVNSNINEIKTMHNENPGDSNKIDKKFTMTYHLLKTITDVGDKHSFKHYDYQSMSLKLLDDKKPNIGKSNREDKSFIEENKDELFEEFSSIKADVVEGFDFGFVTDIIDEIGDGFKLVIDGIIKIVKFVVNLLKDFVLLLFTMLKMLFNFIKNIIPKIIKFVYETSIMLFQNAKKAGLALLIFCIIGGNLWHQAFTCHILPFLAGDRTSDFPPEYQIKKGECPVHLLPLTRSVVGLVYLYGAWMFFFRINWLVDGQNLIIALLRDLFTGPLKSILAFMFGIKTNDELFLKKTKENYFLNI